MTDFYMRIHELTVFIDNFSFTKHIKVRKKILLRKSLKSLVIFRKGKLPTLSPINKEVEFRRKKSTTYSIATGYPLFRI